MAKKTKSAHTSAVTKLKGLLQELRRVQADAGDLPAQVRREVEAAFRGDDLKTVGTSGSEKPRPHRKLGKKKS